MTGLEVFLILTYFSVHMLVAYYWRKNISYDTYPLDILYISHYISISVRYPLDMEIRLKLRKVGSSFMIAIPSQVIRDLKLKVGDNMLLDVKDSGIIIRKERK